MKTIYYLLVFLLATIGAMSQNTKKWAKKKEWANGLQLDLHPTVNTTEFYKAYHTHPQLWAAAFEFLKTHNLDEIKPGKYPIIGDDVFASVTENPSADSANVKWESHRIYTDLQYIIKGKEIIGIADASKATITIPYKVDVMNYTAEGKYYTTEPGKFFLFFPNDAHRPTIKVPGYDVVKKIVIKIKN